jgi:hypothetical protein
MARTVEQRASQLVLKIAESRADRRLDPRQAAVSSWGQKKTVITAGDDGSSARPEVLRFGPAINLTYVEGGSMKKRIKRTKAKSSLKRTRTKSKTRKAKSTKSRKTTKKTLLPKVKRVAKKAALAAGAAAIGTALSELKPEQPSDQQGPEASEQRDSKRAGS